MENVKKYGKIKNYFKNKGYGFITCIENINGKDIEKDYYFYYLAIINWDETSELPGREVEFELYGTDKGPQAVEVYLQ